MRRLGLRTERVSCHVRMPERSPIFRRSMRVVARYRLSQSFPESPSCFHLFPLEIFGVRSICAETVQGTIELESSIPVRHHGQFPCLGILLGCQWSKWQSKDSYES